jgi:hypothetical protein
VRKRRFEPQRIKNTGPVCADVDACSDFLEMSGLLVDVDIDASPQQCERGRESADTPADDGNLERVAIDFPSLDFHGKELH